MNHSELQKLIDAWIFYEDNADSENREDYWWSVEQINDWALSSSGDPNELWQFILAAYKRDLSDRAFGSLAAGALEDLLAHWGEMYIDRIEDLAKHDEKFNHLLGGVWQNAMTDDVWRRVQNARRLVW